MTGQLRYTRDELLADHAYVGRIERNGVLFHGGYDATGTYLPPRSLHRAPAIAAWTAQLQANGHPSTVIDTGAEDPSKESREHAIWREDGLLTIAGGKLTTFALIAREALAAAEEEIGELGDRTRVLEENPAEITWPTGLEPDAQVRLLGRFGAELPDVVRDPALVRPVDGSIVLYAEIAHAARSEGVVHLEDLLLRRARVGLVARNGGLDAIGEIRKIALLGWDDATWDAEEKAYRKLFANAYAI
jgi:glycerol-3-phosphate dehydrogenase